MIRKIQLIKQFVNAAIDVSDGLIADLQHILDASQVGARIEADKIPHTRDLDYVDGVGGLEKLFTAGDDYELCLTVAPANVLAFRQVCQENGISIMEIGVIEQQPGLRCMDRQTNMIQFEKNGYEHLRQD